MTKRFTPPNQLRSVERTRAAGLPDRYPLCGEVVHVLYKPDTMLIDAKPPTLMAFHVTNCDIMGRAFGWLLNDVCNPLTSNGFMPPMIPVKQGLAFDATGRKPNCWFWPMSSAQLDAAMQAQAAGAVEGQEDDAPSLPPPSKIH